MLTILGERQGEPVPTVGSLGDDRISRDRERWLELGEQRQLTKEDIESMGIPLGSPCDVVTVKLNYHKPVRYKITGTYPRSSAADWFFEEEACLP